MTITVGNLWQHKGDSRDCLEVLLCNVHVTRSPDHQ